MIKKNKILYWRAVLSFVFAIFVNIFLNEGFKYVPLLAIIGFLTSYVLFQHKHIEQAADCMLDSKFDNIMGFFYKCLIINISISIFATLIVLVVYYNNKPEYPIANIFYSFFAFFWVLLFVAKKLSIKIPFCDKKEKK
ncbi:hypothetical protein [Sulfurimonas sp.]|uniref:hypothetical protein n=1 Tax=Sulfurimonas sp. TaxID=2022749 RepID=UPI0025EB0A31|nr:hypothetical protein [Sulfurimonas sp.]MBW6487472.1 hypothetical protein [Sulfurimonas sp.]